MATEPDVWPEHEVSACDCCGSRAWKWAFAESGVNLGRCAECGLYYVNPMPTREQRVEEIHDGQFREGESVCNARRHEQASVQIEEWFRSCADLTRRFAPPGKWLDIGCGTGTLIRIAQEDGIEAEGIELTGDRLAFAREVTGAVIHGEPIEQLDLPNESFAAVVMTDVFSHLTSPMESLARIREVLIPGGVLVIFTSEVGPGLQRHHAYTWDLGDHLVFLGEHTIERYAEKLVFDLIHRERQWQPERVFTRERFRVKGRSALRDFIKAVCLYTPGVFPLLRWYMLTKRHLGNPIYRSELVLKKPT